MLQNVFSYMKQFCRISNGARTFGINILFKFGSYLNFHLWCWPKERFAQIIAFAEKSLKRVSLLNFEEAQYRNWKPAGAINRVFLTSVVSCPHNLCSCFPHSHSRIALIVRSEGFGFGSFPSISFQFLANLAFRAESQRNKVFSFFSFFKTLKLGAVRV